jgi:hypothetical protein
VFRCPGACQWAGRWSWVRGIGVTDFVMSVDGWEGRDLKSTPGVGGGV